jgi:hypothetical protein
VRPKYPATTLLQLAALRVALVAVRLPLRFTGFCTWQLESWRSPLQTAINTISSSVDS